MRPRETRPRPANRHLYRAIERPFAAYLGTATSPVTATPVHPARWRPGRSRRYRAIKRSRGDIELCLTLTNVRTTEGRRSPNGWTSQFP